MQPFDITIAPNDVRTIDIQGDFIYYKKGSAGGADATIQLANVGGSQTIYLEPGDYFDLDGVQGTRWAVSNYKKQGTIIGMLMIGSSKFGSNRVTGSVEVIDGGKARSLANTAFLADLAISAGAAYGAVQLWNPANSAKNVVIEQISATLDTANAIAFWVQTAALSTPGVSTVKPKKAGAAVGAGQVYQQGLGALPAAADRYGSISVQANQTMVIPYREPIVIPPGYGFTAVAQAQNTIIRCVYEYFEEGV